MKRQQLQAYEASHTCKQPKKSPIVCNWTKIVILNLFSGSADLCGDVHDFVNRSALFVVS
jgi:hypothetical protein